MTTTNARRVVAITGGARGIGYHTAEELIRRGHRVAIGDIDERQLKVAAEELGLDVAVRLDVTDPASIESFLDVTEEALGSVDVFINNAGVMPTGHVHEEADEAGRDGVDARGQHLRRLRAEDGAVEADVDVDVRVAAVDAAVLRARRERDVRRRERHAAERRREPHELVLEQLADVHAHVVEAVRQQREVRRDGHGLEGALRAVARRRRGWGQGDGVRGRRGGLGLLLFGGRVAARRLLAPLAHDARCVGRVAAASIAKLFSKWPPSPAAPESLQSR